MVDINTTRAENEQFSQPDASTVKEEDSAKTLKSKYFIEPGSPHPLGATPDEEGVNFSVFSDRATAVELLLFGEHDDLEPFLVVQLDPAKHKTFQLWHVYVKGLEPDTHYAYRVDGPRDLSGRGDRYNRNKVLIDPHSKGNTNILWDRVLACNPDDNLTTSMRSVVIECGDYDWEGDLPLKRPMNETIIYELHVRGFTIASSSGCQHPGTFSGIIEKIPYLKDLGITAIELLPIFDFDEKEVKRINPIDGTPLTNYWGYDPFGFFAPQSYYCTSPETGTQITEFRDMVKALHKAGIEVILDVVFNHTSEGNHLGPTISFRGFANDVYYMLSGQDKQYYMNYSGCGNTINGNHPLTVQFIISTLTYWVQEMHIDGFRFDEAVILLRDANGVPMAYPPIIWQIELSDALMTTKIIAEAWDAAGLNAVGYFPGFRWGEWNGHYRDIIRSFVKGDQGFIDNKTMIGRVADALAGSADIFEFNEKLPINSVNFIDAHDGFTLNDIVSYNYKHNEANGENNQDGIDDNLSWNCGIEGETDDPEVEMLRERQIKNFAAILLLSQGVPMFVAGDEIRRTQKGNNNAYCQDNEISWFDWNLLEKNRDIFRFFKLMIAFRKEHPLLQRKSFYSGRVNKRGLADISWHGCLLNSPGWHDPMCKVLSFTMGGMETDDSEDTDIHVILNMDWKDLNFGIPELEERKWYKVVNTAEASPDDIVEPGEEKVIAEKILRVKNRSVVVLISH